MSKLRRIVNFALLQSVSWLTPSSTTSTYLATDIVVELVNYSKWKGRRTERSRDHRPLSQLWYHFTDPGGKEGLVGPDGKS